MDSFFLSSAYGIDPETAQQFQQLVQTRRIEVAEIGDFRVHTVARGGKALVCPKHPENAPVCLLFLSLSCVHCPEALRRFIHFARTSVLPVVLVVAILDRDPELLNIIRNSHINVMPVRHTPCLQLYLNGEPRIENPGEEVDIQSFVSFAIRSLEQEQANLHQIIDGPSLPTPAPTPAPTPLFSFNQFAPQIAGQALVVSSQPIRRK